jgi:hypothetical protein
MLKKAVQQGRRRVETGGVPLGYVEDFDEPRTKLEDFFSILLGELVFCHAIPKCIAGEFEEPACFGDVAACALQGFF